MTVQIFSEVQVPHHHFSSNEQHWGRRFGWDRLHFWVSLLVLLMLIGVLCLLLFWRRRQLALLAQTQQDLAHQRLLMRAVMDAVPYPMLLRAKDGRLLAVNRRYESLFQSLRGDVVGKIEVDTAALSTTLANKLASEGNHVIASGRTFTEELSYRDEHGNDSIASFLMEPIMVPPSQTALGVVGLLIDKSEARRAYALANAAMQRLQDLTDNLSVVVFQLQLTNTGMLKFVFVSGNADGLFGISACAMMEDERSAMARVVPEDREQLLAAVMLSANALEPARLMFRVDNGTEILWLSGQLVPRREADGSTIWNGYWGDITNEREQTTDAAHEAANIAARAKDEFLAMMSHEIRTPMNGVMGLAEVLAGTPMSTDQAALVEMMRDSAGIMLAILDDILDYSKIEAGHLSLSYTAVDLRQLCDQALGLLSAKAQEKRLQLRVQIAAEVAARHLVDSTRLRQILFNLLGNAIKFTAYGSVVLTISVEQEDADLQYLCFTVADTGKGISKEQLSRLFEPFVQEDSSISRRFGGTGLGLSICRRLVTMMNGDITLDSVENVGTVASLKLALVVAERDCSHPVLRGARARVLLSDRNLFLAAENYLTALGMLVVDDAQVDIKIINNTRPEKLELVWGGKEGRASGSLQLNANPLQWGAFRQACLIALRTEVKPAPAALAVATEVSFIRSEHILVAEDNPTNQEVIRRFLQRLNFSCDVVGNGREAFEAMKSKHYALLLTDCHMPEMDGYALVRFIRDIEKRGGLMRMPVVGITASTRAQDEEIARDAGMDACLVKPTGLSVLSDCLEKFLPGVPDVSDSALAEERTAVFRKFDLPGTEPISPLQLKHLESELGTEGKLKVLRIFRDTLIEDLERMPALQDPDLPAWLHRVKGAVAVMEFDTLFSAMQALGENLKDRQEDEHQRLCDYFHQLCDETIAQIDKLLPSEPPGL
ncbi:hypothetical protein FHW67_002683 [Herbaspirillum sp. Sphag1AN]|uniref:PAS domain-containing hybrid sensor histidine kinase/response regulator n=1 Tax=unclassified Herbaspirillum TaxID=2624150 RepID=UPI00161FBC03|nr:MULTISPECIES: PAS domain-containing hybrid sensor histidine kinase/response regulator [unclassified Herbaspirillum]MBB3213391.1 hypothetical protein [Herbaspirillum sp. Sphag1AN]MBB3246565.1 hypothetical protein [Herbaspirillum sp. Sphag64]